MGHLSTRHSSTGEPPTLSDCECPTSRKARDVGHPRITVPTLRTKREEWGTLFILVSAIIDGWGWQSPFSPNPLPHKALHLLVP